MIGEPTICPECGRRTLESSVRADYCTNEDCGYGFYYPDAVGSR